MCSRPRWWAKQRWPPPSPAGVGLRSDEVDAGAVAVVVDGLLDPVAVGVELGADVGERVPLGRVLQRQGDHVVGPHVDVLRVPEVVHLAHVDVVEGAGVAVHVLGRREDRRVAPLVQGGPAGVVERQAQAEADAGLDLADALEDLLGGEQVDAAELVVVAPVAPGRAGRALLPPLRHRSCSFRASRSAPTIGTRCTVPTGWSSLRTRFASPAKQRSGPTERSRARRREVSHRCRRRTSSSPPTGTSSSRSTCSAPACPKHLRDRGVWEEDFEIEPLVEGGARIFRRLHTPGFEGWTISRYRQTGGRMPEGDPEIILEDMDARRGRRPGDAPEPVAVRALLRRPRAVDGPRPRLQRLRHRAVHAVLLAARPHRSHPAHRHRRRRRRDRAGRRRRVPGHPAAGHPARSPTTPGTSTRCGRRPRPTACTSSSTPRPAA